MNRNIRNTAVMAAFVCFTALLMGSCTKDETTGCRVDVTFDYSYNILSANAFSGQVDQAALLVFDSGGTLVWKYTSGTDEVGGNGFRITVPNLPDGEYRFAAWGQSTRLAKEKSFFRIPDLTVGSSRLEELTYFLRRTDGIQQDELNNLLVGVTDPVAIGHQRPAHVEVSLKKVNNRIRVIVLPNTGGAAPDVNDYTFSIEDDTGNGNIGYDFNLLDDQPITYLPYFKANIAPAPTEVPTPGQIDRAAVVEINTSRLMAANAPRLKIKTKNEDRQIVNISLPWLFSLTKMEKHSQWSLQEYLDRQDEYAITLFFDSGNWMKGTVIVNGWIINDVGIEW